MTVRVTLFAVVSGNVIPRSSSIWVEGFANWVRRFSIMELLFPELSRPLFLRRRCRWTCWFDPRWTTHSVTTTKKAGCSSWRWQWHAHILRSSRYKISVTPTTCLHNVASGIDENGDVIEYVNWKTMAPTGNTAFVNDFIGAGYVVDRADAVVIRKSGENEAYNIYWKYGHDATSAVQIKIPRSHFTKNKLSIEKKERRDYRLHIELTFTRDKPLMFRPMVQ